MTYVSRQGKKPNEYASKASHGYIIKDPSIEKFLSRCSLPKKAEEVDITSSAIINLEYPKNNPVNSIIAIDGGYSEVSVQKKFPSSKISFFQFGALVFSVGDLEMMSKKFFIAPEDMAKLKEIQRFKLALPTKNIMFKDSNSLINSVRKSLFEFFTKEPTDDKFIETLKWFLFGEYNTGIKEWSLANCPNPECNKSNIKVSTKQIEKDYTFKCPDCNNKIYLTDVFRLHEAIDDELGAGGILGYLITLLEQIVLIHLIRLILTIKHSLLDQILFIKDGPLAFFGQTANMHKPMRNLVNYLFAKHNLYLAGLEKSGSFVEHANEIAPRLPAGSALLLSNEYIYKYILPGKSDLLNPYGRTTYYGNKVIFKTNNNEVYVVTLPTKKMLLTPQKSDFQNIDVILSNIEKLRCDMYESALIPIALVNKFVSLANHPSSIILEKFAKKKIGN